MTVLLYLTVFDIVVSVIGNEIYKVCLYIKAYRNV